MKNRTPHITDFISIGPGGRRGFPTTRDGGIPMSRKERADDIRLWRKDNPWYWRKMVSAGVTGEPVNRRKCFMAWLNDERRKEKERAK